MTAREVFDNVRRFDLEALFNSFLGLSPQQQTTALVGIAVALVLMLVLPLSIATGQLGGLEDEIAQAEEKINTVVTDVQRYRAVRQRLDAVEGVYRQQTADSLLTVVQRIASEAGLTPAMLNERVPESQEFFEEEKVGFHVKSVTLEQLVKFVHLLESSRQRMMRIKALVVAPVYGNRQLLNAEFKELAAYRLAAEGK